MKDQIDPKNPIGVIKNKDKEYSIIFMISSQSGEGDIYLVKDSTKKEIYVAKVQKEEDLNLKNEIVILQYLKDQGCKSVVKYIDSGIFEVKKFDKPKETKQCIIIEYLKNRDLGDYIFYVHQGFEEGQSKVLFYKILKNLQSLHSNNVYHLDFKLDNILFDDNFDPKIADFGNATKRNAVSKVRTVTYEYLAPEVFFNDEYDYAKVDIFNLGMILICLLTGKYKFYLIDKDERNPEKQTNKFFKAIKSGNQEAFWAPFGEIAQHISNECKQLCFWMLSYNPENRPSIDQIINHPWLQDIVKKDEEDQLNNYEEEKELRKELKKRLKDKLNNNLNISAIKGKASTKAGQSKEVDIFRQSAEPIKIEEIFFMNYYINISGPLHPVDFMNMLCDEIKKEYSNGFIQGNTRSKLKFELDFGNDIKIIITLYKISEEQFALRFMRKNMSKYDFVEKYAKISELIEKIL